MSYGTLSASRHGSVQVIALASDDGMNCYTPEMGEDLVAQLRSAAADPAVAAIVLTAQGRAFCAGAHRSVLAGHVGPSGITIGQEHFITGFAPEFAALPKLTIAALNGSAAGIGMTMSLLCDLRLAVPGARLRFNFAELGLMPGLGSTRRLVELIGLPAAKKLLLCDRTIQSDTAAQIGLVDEIVEPDRLLARALELGEAAAACKPGTLREIKACLEAALDGDLADALAREAQAAARLRGEA
ncbi:MAG: enoyl-CoA hydratase/isomerase family protein [Erythrobacter sp.]|nr:enoyl-CoA hydratase/isomerase family protein [Erythrobacter sp.]